jgi:hypothetical protein
MIAAHGPLWAQWYMLGQREPNGRFTLVVEGNSLLALLGHSPHPAPVGGPSE